MARMKCISSDINLEVRRPFGSGCRASWGVILLPVLILWLWKLGTGTVHHQGFLHSIRATGADLHSNCGTRSGLNLDRFSRDQCDRGLATSPSRGPLVNDPPGRAI